MIVVRTAASAAADRQLYQGRDTHSAWVSPYFGTETMADTSLPCPPEAGVFPVAFLVEEHADATLGVHFHRADQFQVFVRGNGRIGNAAVAPLSVHLARALSPYGPIRAGAQGLAYLTLRNGFDPGPQYMPAAAAQLQRDRASRPHQALHAIPPFNADSAADRMVVLDEGPEGWAIRHHRHAPFSDLRGEAVGGGGQYWVISSGDAAIDGVAMDTLSCQFIARGTVPPRIVAGPSGMNILVLQFPARSDESASAAPD